jgi:hypothetical protein
MSKEKTFTMQLFSAITLVVGSWLCCANPALAQTRETGRWGDWITYEGKSEDGRRLCGLRSRGQVRSIHFKHFEGDSFFVIQLFNDNWTFTQRAFVRISIRLGRESWEWFGDAEPSRASRLPGGALIPAVVAFPIPNGQWDSFWNAFRWQNEGSIDFLTGNEGSWSLSLMGSNAAVLRHWDCISRMGAETRPFDMPRAGGDRGSISPAPKTVPREGPIKSPF